MARRIPDADIQAIRDKARLDEVVGDYVSLKPAGVDSLKGLSPFTDERTPSFHVRPEHGYFHCFSTGEGGDVFTFIMKMEQLGFIEAIEFLADKVGHHINYEGGAASTRVDTASRSRLFAANNAAAEFYQQQLRTDEAAAAREFLIGRGFDGQCAQTFGCGYSPSGWDTLTKHLVAMGFSVKELEAAGLSKQGPRGPIDRFHRRLMWPIRGLTGDTIGFGARKLFDDDQLGKYMNTPETTLYKKSQVLFGIDLAKKSISQQKNTVVVEGYTDVMAMHAAGVTTAVAPCGTAFGEDHQALIRRIMMDNEFNQGRIVFTFDGDAAGQKAALKAFSSDQKLVGQQYVAIAPDGMDPCDLRQRQGDEALASLVATAQPMFEFVIRSRLKAYDLDSAEARVAAVRDSAQVLGQIKNVAVRHQYTLKLSSWIGIEDFPFVKETVERAARGLAVDGFTPVQPQKSQIFPDPASHELLAQREVLKAGLQFPELCGGSFDALTLGSFTHPAYRSIFEAAMRSGGCLSGLTGSQWVSAVMQQVPDDLKDLVSMLVVEAMPVQVTKRENYIKGIIAGLEYLLVKSQIEELKSRQRRSTSAPEGEKMSEAEAQAVRDDLYALEFLKRQLRDQSAGSA